MPFCTEIALKYFISSPFYVINALLPLFTNISTNYLWGIESTGIDGEFILFKCTKYFRDDLTLVMHVLQCFNSITESSSDSYENYSQLVRVCCCSLRDSPVFIICNSIMQKIP